MVSNKVVKIIIITYQKFNEVTGGSVSRVVVHRLWDLWHVFKQMHPTTEKNMKCMNKTTIKIKQISGLIIISLCLLLSGDIHQYHGPGSTSLLGHPHFMGCGTLEYFILFFLYTACFCLWLCVLLLQHFYKCCICVDKCVFFFSISFISQRLTLCRKDTECWDGEAHWWLSHWPTAWKASLQS